jgi:hypothetical protein
MKYLRLFHDNASAHKARNATEYLEAENVSTVLPTHPPPHHLLQILLHATSFCSPNLNSIYLEKETNHEMPLGNMQYMMGIPIEEYEKCFLKWIDRLKNVSRPSA